MAAEQVDTGGGKGVAAYRGGHLASVECVDAHGKGAVYCATTYTDLRCAESLYAGVDVGGVVHEGCTP